MERSASSPGHFTIKENAHGTHWIEGWVRPNVGLDAVEKRKISCSCRESEPDSTVRPAVRRYVFCAIPAPILQATTINNRARLFASIQTGAICKSVASCRSRM
jgi:hypothetical protein